MQVSGIDGYNKSKQSFGMLKKPNLKGFTVEQMNAIINSIPEAKKKAGDIDLKIMKGFISTHADRSGNKGPCTIFYKWQNFLDKPVYADSKKEKTFAVIASVTRKSFVGKILHSLNPHKNKYFALSKNIDNVEFQKLEPMLQKTLDEAKNVLLNNSEGYAKQRLAKTIADNK